MCGLVGIIANYQMSKNAVDFMSDGLYADALRGFDSTGIACIPKNIKDDVVVHKRALAATDFIDLSSTHAVLNAFNNYQGILGHNRKATIGKINNNNSHPFQVGNITLTHNGSLRNMYTLPDSNKYTVDSALITHLINDRGVDATIKLLDGAFALVWYDAAYRTVNMIRNDERPLNFAVLDDGDYIAYASEEHMITWLAQRNNLEVTDMYDIAPGDLVTFKLAKQIKEYDCRTLELYKPKTKPLLPRYTNNAGNTIVNINDKSKGKGERKAEVILSNNGLEFDEQVDFSVYDWATADGLNDPNKRGLLLGITDSEPFLGVEVYNVPGHLVDITKSYTGKIMSARYSPHMNGDVAIVLYDVYPADNLEGPSIDGTRKKKDNNNKEKDKRSNKKEMVAGGPAPINLQNVEPFLNGPNNVLIPRTEWLRLTKTGCIQCASPISEHLHDDVVWISDNSPMCSQCVDDWNRFVDGSQRK